jgi:hypothetical protein
MVRGIGVILYIVLCDCIYNYLFVIELYFLLLYLVSVHWVSWVIGWNGSDPPGSIGW